MLRYQVFVSLLILLALQYPLWIEEGGFSTVYSLSRELAWQEGEILRLQERNDALLLEVQDLRAEGDAVEEIARMDLGMIRDGEKFIQVVP